MALNYRSLSIVPTVAAYNNRAQAEIKLMHWQNALHDCQKVLELDVGNMKGGYFFHKLSMHMDSYGEDSIPCIVSLNQSFFAGFKHDFQ